MQKVFKLNPFYSEKVWGYEEWNLSTHKNGNSTVQNTNQPLSEVLKKDLPILIKIIQANDTLSVQVHPGEDYAKEFENDRGKTECWYILDAKENATLICGIKKGLDKNNMQKIIDENNIESCLKRIDVKKGDMIYIPSGTVHAIEGGIKLIEVQQSSDITYRMYDWGRDREMHIKKAIDVIDYNEDLKAGKIEDFNKLTCEHFTVEKVEVDKALSDKVLSDFYTYTVIEGNGYIVYDNEKIHIKEEETVYLCNGTEYQIEGNLKLLKSYV